MMRQLGAILILNLILMGCGKIPTSNPDPVFPPELLFRGDKGDTVKMHQSTVRGNHVPNTQPPFTYPDYPRDPNLARCTVVGPESSQPGCSGPAYPQLPSLPGLPYLSPQLPTRDPYIGTFLGMAYYLRSIDPNPQSIVAVGRMLAGGSSNVISGQAHPSVTSAQFNLNIETTNATTNGMTNATIDLVRVSPVSQASGSVTSAGPFKLVYNRNVPIGMWKPDDGILFVLRTGSAFGCSQFGSGGGGDMWSSIYFPPCYPFLPPNQSITLKVSGRVNLYPPPTGSPVSFPIDYPINLDASSILNFPGESRTVSQGINGGDEGVGVRTINFTGLVAQPY